jgi:acetyltransferase-like isoleucine patch superfamily enzyme
MAQKNKSSIILGKNVTIEDYSIINNHNGFIEIGDYSTINHYSMIQSTVDNRVTIGEKVAIAPYTRIVPNHSYEGENRTGTIHASTTIGDNVWIGAGVTIVIGSNIGKNSIVGANSVVTRDIEDNVVAAGTPAKLIKTFQEYVQKQNS